MDLSGSGKGLFVSWSEQGSEPSGYINRYERFQELKYIYLFIVYLKTSVLRSTV